VTLGLFGGYGIELEYMLVDAATFDVRPMADSVLAAVAGGPAAEVETGELAWSNELVLHVIELKTNGPRANLAGLSEAFHRDLVRIGEILGARGARLLPTAMHPWMDPGTETRLWPHEYNQVYEAFDRIFDCRGHGWSNLQSTHINFPFDGDEEFGRLHAAIRLVLPLLPALAASSPFVSGAPSGLMDTRLDFYRKNCLRVPSVTGRVVPERCFTRAEYEETLLGGLYRDIAPLDPEGVLRHEWLNARGAIARFDRDAIEIRLLDIQECPRADMAIAGAVIGVVRALVEERWAPWATQREWPEERLASILDQTIREGDRAVISDTAWLRDLGVGAGKPVAGLDLWRDLVGRTSDLSPIPGESGTLDSILEAGSLSARILDAWERSADLGGLYRDLADCLARNELYV
jgi:hypothetical protein